MTGGLGHCAPNSGGSSSSGRRPTLPSRFGGMPSRSGPFGVGGGPSGNIFNAVK